MRAAQLKAVLPRELLASVVVFLVALPLCMGIAIASGMPPAKGLITGIIGGLVVGWLAGSPLQVSGPAAGLAVLVFELVRQHGMAMLGPILLLAGFLQLVAGRLRLGCWFRVTAPAVVYGMLAGIGVLIVLSQVHVMLDGVPKPSGLDNLAGFPAALIQAIPALGGGLGWQAGLLGLSTILVMWLWDKFRPQKLRFVPGALLGVGLATVTSLVLALQVKRVEVPENLADAIDWLRPSDLLNLADPNLLIAAFAVAFIASAETLLSAAAVDRMHSGQRSDFDKELSAQGVGNMLCGLVGALPMTGVIVRSSANVQAGATTRLSAMFHGVWLLGFVLLLSSVLQSIPVASLAGVLVYTGIKLDLHCDFEAVAHLYTTPDAWPQVEPLARYIGSEANLLATDSGGQSFDECFTLVWWQLQQRFGERFPIPLGSFSVTVELRGQGDVNHGLASLDCQAIIDYLIHFGAIAGDVAPLPALPYPATPLAGVEPVATPVGGLLVFSALPGEYLEAGQLIAEIIDPITDRVTPVRCQKAGLLYARSLRLHLRPSSTLLSILSPPHTFPLEVSMRVCSAMASRYPPMISLI